MKQYQHSKQEKSVLEHLKVPFAVYQYVNKRVVALCLSDGFCALFGYEDQRAAYYDMNHDMYQDVHPDDAARLGNAAVQFAAEGGKYDVIYRTKIRDSSDYRVIHAIGEHVFTEDGTRLAQVWYADEGVYDEEAHGSVLNRAMSNALHKESMLQASRYDYLTGLPSMTWFFETVEESEKAMEQRGERPALLYMDLAGMKFFNTKHSFADGDRLLRAFAKRLSQVFDNENCCRIGADHFAVLAKADGLEDTLSDFFEKWSKEEDGNTLPVHVGIYPSKLEGLPASSACDRAKMACDRIKNDYVSGFNYYDEGMRDDAEQRQYILANLDRAIREKWITAYYQPIVRAVNSQVCDVEALARWNDPEKGFLSPAEFIPFLEESKQIYRLDLHILDCVLEKMTMQRDAGINVVPHSINLSRSDFHACDIVEEIRLRVDAAGIRRDRISIEITESTIGTDFDFMKEQVQRFRELGFPVWMDDFGSGYSSLDVLQSIRFDLLKFDMGFMRKLDEGDNGKIILTELMKMAGALGVDTVCEGVETEKQLRFLQEIGCSKLQGYYFSKPVPLEKILERHRTGLVLGSEKSEEAEYYEAISRVNLYDLAVMSSGEENSFQNYFNTLPMGILEVKDEKIRYVRSNSSYRDFMKRFFGLELKETDEFTETNLDAGSAFIGLVRSCCESGNRAFFDEKMPDGSVVHSFARRIAANPVTGTAAVAVAVLSVTGPDEERERLEEMNRGRDAFIRVMALSDGYLNLITVDAETGHFIQYSSSEDYDSLGAPKEGNDFFEQATLDAKRFICTEDQPAYLARFTKENVMREIQESGSFKAQFRLMINGEAKPVAMKIAPFREGSREKLVVGVRLWKDRQ